MASGAVTAPISISLADFLATAVSDGTYADIVSVTKTDAASPGPTPASQIEEYGGQLYGNLVDDMWLVNYQAQYKAAKWWTVADATAKLALGSDDALAVNDLLFQVSDKTLHYCTAVTGGGTSTWATIAAQVGGGDEQWERDPADHLQAADFPGDHRLDDELVGEAGARLALADKGVLELQLDERGDRIRGL